VLLAGVLALLVALVAAPSRAAPPRADFVYAEGELDADRRVKGLLREGHTTLEWEAEIAGASPELLEAYERVLELEEDADRREAISELLSEVAGSELIFEVESAVGGAFETGAVPRYEGRDRVSFISGLETGTHAFRVRARVGEEGEWGPWSEPVSLEVKHQSLALAWSLFFTGLVLFACIVTFVVTQARVASDAREGADG